MAAPPPPLGIYLVRADAYRSIPTSVIEPRLKVGTTWAKMIVARMVDLAEWRYAKGGHPRPWIHAH